MARSPTLRDRFRIAGKFFGLGRQAERTFDDALMRRDARMRANGMSLAADIVASWPADPDNPGAHRMQRAMAAELRRMAEHGKRTFEQ